jgi:hypothetical protein
MDNGDYCSSHKAIALDLFILQAWSIVTFPNPLNERVYDGLR